MSETIPLYRPMQYYTQKIITKVLINQMKHIMDNVITRLIKRALTDAVSN